MADEQQPAWATVHDERWPWCGRHDKHTHTDAAGRTYVDGRPAGPVWNLPKTATLMPWPSIRWIRVNDQTAAPVPGSASTEGRDDA